ncbi:hypothetical protein Sango_0789200 [Sesamum angolense]|uniref:Uncharacterized protein n=1 Tax=Sesamum angolense TaxID=2727404 RepID=A0AAE1X311_9LAMI|nr:hypothetical protein Sango_0789200 [Sesamum angolense]
MAPGRRRSPQIWLPPLVEGGDGRKRWSPHLGDDHPSLSSRTVAAVQIGGRRRSKAPHEKWYQSLGAIMGPRWVFVTQANSAARILGPDAENPRHAASPSERAVNPEDENSQLTELVMNLEENASSLETEITMLNSELDEYINPDRFAPTCGEQALVVAHDPGARLRIPEPKAYSGAHDAKEVENFLFDIEQYFLAANARTRQGKCRLRQCSMRDYVKVFLALMLDIRDMSEKDKLFTFMESLKPWARLEQ